MFRMCLLVGCPHPDYLLTQLTSRQVSEWVEYFNLEPFGEDRADWRIAQLCALFANANRDREKTRAFEVRDFMLREQAEAGPKREQTPEEMMAVLGQFTSGAQGGRRSPRRSAHSPSF